MFRANSLIPASSCGDFFFQLSWGFEHQFEVLRFDQRTQRNVLICSTEFPQGISLDYGESFQIFLGNAILDE
jgi:hypothetical protein